MSNLSRFKACHCHLSQVYHLLDKRSVLQWPHLKKLHRQDNYAVCCVVVTFEDNVVSNISTDAFTDLYLNVSVAVFIVIVYNRIILNKKVKNSVQYFWKSSYVKRRAFNFHFMCMIWQKYLRRKPLGLVVLPFTWFIRKKKKRRCVELLISWQDSD